MDERMAFVHARLDDEERDARAAAKETGNPVWTFTGDYVMAEQPGYPGSREYVAIAPWDGDVPEGVGNHIARHDPARTLREVEAKRRLLEQFRLRGDSVRRTVQPSTGGVWDDLLRLLAQPYSDHPDYQESWKP